MQKRKLGQPRHKSRAEFASSFIELAREHSEKMRAELDVWRKRHPHEARYVREEAAAMVEKRVPDYPPPICIGASPSGE